MIPQNAEDEEEEEFARIAKRIQKQQVVCRLCVRSVSRLTEITENIIQYIFNDKIFVILNWSNFRDYSWSNRHLRIQWEWYRACTAHVNTKSKSNAVSQGKHYRALDKSAAQINYSYILENDNKLRQTQLKTNQIINKTSLNTLLLADVQVTMAC
jgi:hypothetical protein